MGKSILRVHSKRSHFVVGKGVGFREEGGRVREGVRGEERVAGGSGFRGGGGELLNQGRGEASEKGGKGSEGHEEGFLEAVMTGLSAPRSSSSVFFD